MKKKSFLYRNSLSIALLFIFFCCLAGQAFTGWKQYNEEMEERGGEQVNFPRYLGTSHFTEATFENFESEFLQMGMYILLTIFLRQKGSSESKSLDEAEEVDREPEPHKGAPWPVRKGGVWLALYRHSLSIAFIVMFFLCFIIHSRASLKEYNKEQALEGKAASTYTEFLGNSKLWFESFQNWQSEFLAVFSIVVLSIFLRQQGSPQSKPVDAPDSETEE